MLTRHDRTVANALDTLRSLRGVGLRHVGWKDMGASREVMMALQGEAKQQGATTYLEMVSLGAEAEERGARYALDVGVDVLLGGVHVDRTLAVLRGSRVKYCPFAGIPAGHPTILRGDAARIESDCRRYAAAGCGGVDLLAYRSVDADPLDLVAAARAGLGSGRRVLCAGGVSCPGQWKAIARSGGDAFTIGTAIFNDAIDPEHSGVIAQVQTVLAMLDRQAPESARQASRPRRL